MLDLKTKILVVDDVPANLVVLEAVLQDLDVELIMAESGKEALEAVEHHNFALALLDIQMPEMDGYELADRLRQNKRTQSLPFIFISAVYNDNANIFRGYEKGAFSFITKPFQPEILINKVKLFVEKHQQEIALSQLNQDLQKSNSELRNINQELESFSYSVSHDLRTPLRAINGYSQILLEDYSDTLDAEGKRLLNAIENNAKKMGVLIDDLLEFSRLGRKSITKNAIDMNSLWQKALSEITRNEPHNARIIIHPLLPAEADQSVIYQVLLNLLSNAIKYSAKCADPVVEVTSYHKNEDVVYQIKDNGVGFDEHYSGKLFGVFQRLHSIEEFKGTGIGLALVKRIINKHGGEVWANGTVNKGATFSFSLPLA